MKKSLFAIAAVGAFVSTAQAQSSVTVYGLIDSGIAQTSIDYNTVQKQNQTNIGGLPSLNGTGTLSGSRLGFRGIEDLGGGTRAGFVYETAVNYTNTAATTTAATMTDSASAANGAALFANVRQAYASLSNTKFGELRLGTQNTLAKDSTESIDPMGGPNITGSGSLYQQGLVTRLSNMAIYQAPTMMGVTVRLSTSVDGTASNNGGATAANATPTSNRSSAASLDFTQGKIKVAAVYERRTTWYQAAGSANSMVALGTNGTTAAVIPTINYFAAGASYDLGMVKPAVLYFNQQGNGATNASTGRTSGTLIGVTVPVSKAASVMASYTPGKVENNGATVYNTTGMQLVGNYNLSKRTGLYAAYGSTNWDSQSTSVTSSTKVQQYGLGMRHSF